MDKLPSNPNESLRKLNPHIWPNAGGSLCRMASDQPQQAALRALDKGVQKRQKGKGSVEVVVSLVACRRNELDDDNNVASLKPLRDAIAETLGLDDGDRRIRFECGQTETRGRQGVIVKIEQI